MTAGSGFQRKRRHPPVKDSPTARDFEIEYRLAARDRLQLALIRRMFETHHGQARAALAQLFPRGAPDNAIGIEYYRLLAGTPNGWLPAYQGTKRLITLHADDPNYQLALSRGCCYGATSGRWKRCNCCISWRSVTICALPTWISCWPKGFARRQC